MLLDCDVVRKDVIMKKLEDGRKFNKSKTGLESRFLAPQRYDKGRYKIFQKQEVDQTIGIVNHISSSHSSLFLFAFTHEKNRRLLIIILKLT